MKTAWITGANGLIGHHLVQAASQFAPRWRVRPLVRPELDLLDFPAVERAFARERPELVIHCAAITVVSEAQKNPGLARRVNVEVTRFLSQLAADVPMVFFSTDLVFDGRKGNYTECDAVNPLHVYGETKLAAEQWVLQNPLHLVVRTSINAGRSPSGNRAFNEQLRCSLQTAGQGMTLFTDEFRCPIPAAATAQAVWDLVEQGRAGLYHLAGTEKLSRWDIGRLLVPRWRDISVELKAGSARDFSGPARALDTSLDVSKVQKILSQRLPGFGKWLAANPHEPL
jgi:dTDP-4-dehydrorhamnose reductase